MLRFFFLIPLALLPLLPQLAAGQNSQGSLEVVVRGLSPGHGNLLVYLYDNPKDWLKTKRARHHRALPVPAAETMALRFDALPVGEYAVSVVQDINGNGKMDTRRIIPIPREPTGLSNNHKSAGKPRYSKAKFALEAGLTRLEIALRPCPGRCIKVPAAAGK